MFYYTYVLLCTNKSKENCFYIGYTKNIQERFQRHLNKEVRTTKKFDSLKLIYLESCLNKTDARKRELQLKTDFGRGYIKKRNQNFLKLL